MDAKTKKILIYGAVALGAYLLYKKYSKKDETVVVVTDEEVMNEAAGRRRMSKRRVPTTQKAGIFLHCMCRDKSGRYNKKQCRTNKFGDSCEQCCGFHGQEQDSHVN